MTRQKTALALLQQAGRPIDKLKFVKLLFLLRQETCLREEPSFYDFVPYNFGPFSFALYREIDTLVRDGYVVTGEHDFSLAPEGEEATVGKVETLPNDYREAVSEVYGRYGSLSTNALLRDVYARYAWYGTRTQRPDLLPPEVPKAPQADPAVYTAGYEGHSVDAFFDHLLKNGIQSVLDVRANPFSRKYGFSGKALKGIAANLKIEYHHFPELGIPSEQRAGLSDEASYERLFAMYERDILPGQDEAIEKVAGLMGQRPSVLVCMEEKPSSCHRGRLAGPVSAESGLDIVHL